MADFSPALPPAMPPSHIGCSRYDLLPAACESISLRQGVTGHLKNKMTTASAPLCVPLYENMKSSTKLGVLNIMHLDRGEPPL